MKFACAVCETFGFYETASDIGEDSFGIFGVFSKEKMRRMKR